MIDLSTYLARLGESMFQFCYYKKKRNGLKLKKEQLQFE